jgi:ketosteroid isomerase-like protein
MIDLSPDTTRSSIAPDEASGAELTEAEAQSFARAWIAAWNRGDIEGVLAHFADGARFVSPKAALVVGNALVEGKAALREYWQRALERVGSVEFTLEEALWSPRAATLTVRYRTVAGGAPAQRAVELMRFRGQLVVEGEALYGAIVTDVVPA